MKKLFAAVVMSISASVALAGSFGSQSVLVVEDGTGKILIEKNANTIVPIASLTKLMTAMVVLDAKQDMNELIAIDRNDVDTFKFSTSRVPVGAKISRADILQLALMSSDNRAAASLARTFPGGPAGFKAAVKAKTRALGMTQTVIEEPTGLSPNNKSTATDLVKMALAASAYPEIARMSTDTNDTININGRGVEYRNTNRLVGAKGWDIGLSKTGYTQEAGRCLIMRITAAGKNATLVLLNAGASSVRIVDALSIRRFMTGGRDERVAKVRAHPRARDVLASKAPRVMKASLRTKRFISAGKVKPVLKVSVRAKPAGKRAKVQRRRR